MSKDVFDTGYGYGLRRAGAGFEVIDTAIVPELAAYAANLRITGRYSEDAVARYAEDPGRRP